MKYAWDHMTLGDLLWLSDMVAFRNYAEENDRKRAEEKAKREARRG